MLVKQADLLKVYISKDDIEKLLYGEKLYAQDNDGKHAVTIILEDVCRGRRLSDEESQAALTREQIEQQKVIRDMEKYLDREDK